MRNQKARRLSRRDIRAIHDIAARKGASEATIDMICLDIEERLTELEEARRFVRRNPIGFC